MCSASALAATSPRRSRSRTLVASTVSSSARPRPGGPNQYPMPAVGVEAFGGFPTMEREAGLRLMVENSLGEHVVRERPELVDEVYAYRLERAPPLEAGGPSSRPLSPSTRSTAWRGSRRRPSSSTEAVTRSSTERRAARRADPECAAAHRARPWPTCSSGKSRGSSRRSSSTFSARTSRLRPDRPCPSRPRPGLSPDRSESVGARAGNAGSGSGPNGRGQHASKRRLAKKLPARGRLCPCQSWP